MAKKRPAATPASTSPAPTETVSYAMDAALAARLEAATQSIGRELWHRLQQRRPTLFERRWWLDHILEWAMRDESIKVQMFRFVDVLPSLRSSESVAQHLQEYFDEVRSRLPMTVRLGLDIAQPDSLLGKALAINARRNAGKMAERFIAGTKVEEVLHSVARLRKRGLAFTLDLLGEAVISEHEASSYQNAYLNLIRNLAPQVNNWLSNDVLDRSGHAFLPRCNVSLKLSALYSRFKPIDPSGSAAGVKERLRPILRLACELDAFVHVDMEHYAFKDLSLRIFQEVLMEDEFRDWANCGIVIQAYLRDADSDLQNLKSWVERRGTPIWVRLVKGAYWEYETVHAEYNGWPCPVFENKQHTDASFERLTGFLMQNRQLLHPAIASHNLRSLAHAMAWAGELHLNPGDWEIQMLYGMAEDQQQLFCDLGYRVRVYAPFGEMIPGMAYLVRRLLENTSNDSFLRHAFDDKVNLDELFAAPQG